MEGEKITFNINYDRLSSAPKNNQSATSTCKLAEQTPFSNDTKFSNSSCSQFTSEPYKGCITARSFRPAFKYYYFQYITAQEKLRRALPWASNGRNKKIDSSDPLVFKRCFKSCNIKFQVPRNLITDTDNFQISDPSLTSPNGVLGELRITMI